MVRAWIAAPYAVSKAEESANQRNGEEDMSEDQGFSSNAKSTIDHIKTNSLPKCG